jgi:hypothetical protein
MLQQSYCFILFSCAVLATGREKEDWNGTEKELRRSSWAIVEKDDFNIQKV